MSKAILFLLCCLPAFADSVTSTQLNGTFFSGTSQSVAACFGSTGCQASFSNQFIDPEYPAAIDFQTANINASASFLQNQGADPRRPEYIDPEQARGYVYVPIGSYLLSAILETFDGSQGASVEPYVSPRVTLAASFYIPQSSGDVQMRIFYEAFTTLPYGVQSASVSTPLGSYDLIADAPESCTYSPNSTTCQEVAGRGYAPELDLTIPHTPGTAGEVISFSAFSSTFRQETNGAYLDAIITPTPEPSTFGMMFGSLVLGGLVVGWRKSRSCWS